MRWVFFIALSAALFVLMFLTDAGARDITRTTPKDEIVSRLSSALVSIEDFLADSRQEDPLSLQNARNTRDMCGEYLFAFKDVLRSTLPLRRLSDADFALHRQNVLLCERTGKELQSLMKNSGNGNR